MDFNRRAFNGYVRMLLELCERAREGFRLHAQAGRYERLIIGKVYRYRDGLYSKVRVCVRRCQSQDEASYSLRRILKRAVFNFKVLLFPVPRHGFEHGQREIRSVLNENIEFFEREGDHVHRFDDFRTVRVGVVFKDRRFAENMASREDVYDCLRTVQSFPVELYPTTPNNIVAMRVLSIDEGDVPLIVPFDAITFHHSVKTGFVTCRKKGQ